MQRILKNRIRCRNCGDVIESTDTNELVTCSCGSVSIAGGHEYFRRICRNGPKDIEELSVVEQDDDEEEDSWEEEERHETG